MFYLLLKVRNKRCFFIEGSQLHSRYQQSNSVILTFFQFLIKKLLEMFLLTDINFSCDIFKRVLLVKVELKFFR